MPLLSERLALLVSLDARGAITGLESVGRSADRNLAKLEGGLARTGKQMQRVGVGMVTTGGLIAFGLYKAAQASEEANLAQVRLENTLKNNPRLAGETSRAYIELANSLQAKTAAENDSIIAGIAMLGTFRVTGDQIKKLTPLVVDYARKFGVDLVSANAQVGKALDGNVAALKRNGVTIDEALFKTDRYAAVQKALAEQVGGFAEAEGATFAGSVERMKNRVGDLVEKIGSGAVPVFEGLFKGVEATVGGFERLNSVTDGTAGSMATIGAVGLIAAGGLSFLLGKAIQFGGAIKDLPSNIKKIGSSLSFLSGGGGAAVGLANLTVGLTVLGTVVYSLRQKSNEAKTAIAELRGEAEATGRSLQQVAVDKLIADLAKSDSARGAVESLGLSIGDVVDALQGSPAAFDAWKRSVEQTAKDRNLGHGYVENIVVPVEKARRALRGATDEAKFAASANRDLGKSNRDVAGSATDAADATLDQAAAYQTLSGAQESLLGAQVSYESALLDLTDTTSGFGRASGGAGRSVKDFAKDIERAKQSVDDAKESLRDAQKALDEARKPASARELDEGKIGVDQAKIAQERAAQRVIDAEKNLQDVRERGGSAAEIHSAELDLQDARIAQREAVYGLQDAEKALADTRKKGTSGDQAVIDAQRRVRDQYRTLIDATDALRDAQDRTSGSAGGLGRSSRDLARDQNELKGKVQRTTDVLADLTIKMREANGEVLTAKEKHDIWLSSFDQVIAKLDPKNPLRRELEAYSKLLHELPDEVKTDLNVEIFAKLRAALGESGGTAGVGVHGGPAPRRRGTQDDRTRARGGPVRRGLMYLVGEEGPELFTPGSSGTIIPNRQLAGSHAAVGAAVAERPSVTNVFNITALDPAAAAKAVKDALASSSRRGVA